MNVQSPSNPTAHTSDIYTTTLIPGRRWIASAVALVMTSLTLSVVSLPIRTASPSWIGDLRVTNLAAVEVTPDGAAQQAALALKHAAVGSAAANAAQLGAQLAMPYYSFGANANVTVGGKE